MKTLTVSASRRYEVVIGHGLLPSVGEWVKALLPKARLAAVVTDSNVAPLYLETVTASLQAAGFTPVSFVFPAGEQSKNGETYLALLEFLAASQITRSDVILALGGGVVGDLTGFAAATYLRGTAFIQLPTTLLAAVDSSVGGKTAIDLTAGKNLAGAFSQPHLVLCDLDSFHSLPDAVFWDGCAEVIKYGMIGSPQLLQALLEKPIHEQLESVVSLCVSMKRDIVERDEFDEGDRQLLNFGHTLGHAIERCSKYTLSHGQAVAIGMMMMTRAAVGQALCPPDCLRVLEQLLERHHLPNHTSFSDEELYEGALGDKKRAGGSLTIVVPTALGECQRSTIPMEELKAWMKGGRAP